jgi:hypothetical protein
MLVISRLIRSKTSCQLLTSSGVYLSTGLCGLGVPLQAGGGAFLAGSNHDDNKEYSLRSYSKIYSSTKVSPFTRSLVLYSKLHSSANVSPLTCTSLNNETVKQSSGPTPQPFTVRACQSPLRHLAVADWSHVENIPAV